MSFRGEFNHTIDPKNRLIVPAKFREQLGENFVVAAGLDGCLYLCTSERWDQFLDHLDKLPFNANNRKVQRFFGQHSADVEVDKAGRILIPQKLVTLAGFTKDIVLIGVGEKIEVWAKEKLEGESLDTSVEEMMESLSEVEGLRF